jgi:simple sugar transport system permease protein
MNVERNITLALALSGSLAGVAGAILVFGSEGQRMVTDGSAAGFTGSAGFNGIVAALFGGLHPLWTVPSAMLFGALLTGATQLQRVLQVPAALAVALNGIVVIFVVSSTPARAWILKSLTDAGLFNRRSDSGTKGSGSSREGAGDLPDLPDSSEGSGDV